MPADPFTPVASDQHRRAKELGVEYDKYFTGKVLREHPVYYETFAKLCSGRTLDVGCANGGWLLGLVPNSLGVDVSRKAIGDIRQRGHRGVVGDAHFLPFPDRFFNTVVSLGALEHFGDPKRALAEMARVLDDGGHLVLTFNSTVSASFLVLEQLMSTWSRIRGQRFMTQPIDGRVAVDDVMAVLAANKLRVVLEGSYSVQTLSFGRFQKWLLRLPLRWRTTPCVNFVYCEKTQLEKTAEYGPYFPRR